MWHFRRRQPVSLDEVLARINDVSSRVAVFEHALEAAGMALESAAGDADAQVSPSLLAATRCHRAGGEPVRLDVNGVPMIAVVSGEGDPAAWQQAITEYAHPSYGTPPGTAKIGRTALPAGLWALARHGSGTAYWVAEGLPQARQRAALLTAAKAARRSGWRAPALAPAALLAARGAARTIRSHLAASVGTAAALAGVTVAAVFLMPAHAPRAGSPWPRPPASRAVPGRGGSPRRSSPPGGAPGRAGPALAGAGAPRSPGQSLLPGALPTAVRSILPSPLPSRLPVPVPTVTVPVPVPSHLPSPPPLPSPHPTVKVKICVKWLLGICVKWKWVIQA